MIKLTSQTRNKCLRQGKLAGVRSSRKGRTVRASVVDQAEKRKGMRKQKGRMTWSPGGAVGGLSTNAQGSLREEKRKKTFRYCSNAQGKKEQPNASQERKKPEKRQ